MSELTARVAKGKIFSFIGSRMALVTPARPDTETLLELSVHEFRTPVSVLVGYSRMLLAEHFGPLTEKQRQLIGEIQKSSHRLVELTKEMSELLKLESNTAPIARDEVDLESVVQEAAAAATEGQDRGVTLEHQSEENSLLIEGDRRRLIAAVGDMLRAVLREQGEPTAVKVRTSRITISGHPMAAVAIGVGEAARIVLEQTDPEARLNEGRGGLGFVLPIARRLVERHGGRIWSFGEDPKIGTIAFVLPLKETRS